MSRCLPMAAKSAAELADKLRRDINSLSDENRGARSRALKNLERALLGKGKPKKAVVTEYVNGHLLEPLANVLSDPVENCREAGLGMLTQLVESGALRDAYPALRTCLPVLVRRVGKFPSDEGAEEVRLLIARLLLQFLKAKSCRRTKKAGDGDGDDDAPAAAGNGGAPAASAGGSGDTTEGEPQQPQQQQQQPKKKQKLKRPSPLEAHLGELCVIIAALLRDGFADVKLESAAALDEVCGLFPQHMHLHLGLLVEPLLANVLHVQHRYVMVVVVAVVAVVVVVVVVAVVVVVVVAV